MKLKNHTDIDTELVRQIIRAVCPSGISRFDVRVSNFNGRGCRGRAYHKGSGYHATADQFVVVSIAPTEEKARYISKGGKGYLPSVYGSRLEALVFVLAHELRHLWQGKVKKGWRVWGAKGQFSERDADAYGLRMLRKYRRGELFESPAPK